MEEYVIVFSNKQYVVPQVKYISDLIPILLKDLGILAVTFIHNNRIILPSCEHKNYPFLLAESDGHSYTQSGKRFRCIDCHQFIKESNYKCSHSSKCRKKANSDSKSLIFQKSDLSVSSFGSDLSFLKKELSYEIKKEDENFNSYNNAENIIKEEEIDEYAYSQSHNYFRTPPSINKKVPSKIKENVLSNVNLSKELEYHETRCETKFDTSSSINEFKAESEKFTQDEAFAVGRFSITYELLARKVDLIVEDKIFKVKCDLKHEQNLRSPLNIYEMFTDDICNYCKKKIEKIENREDHVFRCKAKDIFFDPFREKIGTHTIREFRWECKDCLQRFFDQDRAHVCLPDNKNRTLCLFCDKYVQRIAKHHKKCKWKSFFDKNKFKILEEYFRRRLAFLRRIDKLLLWRKNKLPPQPLLLDKINKNILISQTKFSLFQIEYKKIVSKPGPNWKPFYHYDSPMFSWSQRKITVFHGNNRGQDPIAAKGLIPLEEFRAKKVRESWDYLSRKRGLKEISSSHEIYKERERRIFNKVAKDWGIEWTEDGTYKWIPVPIENDTLPLIKESEYESPLVPIKEEFPSDIEESENEVLCLATPRRNSLISVKEESEVEKACQELITEKKEEEVSYFYIRSDSNLVKFYQEYFPNFTWRNLIYFTESASNYVALVGEDIVGAMTYDIKDFCGVKLVYLKLLCVDKNLRRKGIGKTLWNEAMRVGKGKILLWVDNGASSKKFYSKMGTKSSKTLWYSLQLEIEEHKQSVFSYIGLSKEEINKLKAWGNEQLKKRNEEELKKKMRKKTLIKKNKSKDNRNLSIQLNKFDPHIRSEIEVYLAGNPNDKEFYKFLGLKTEEKQGKGETGQINKGKKKLARENLTK